MIEIHEKETQKGPIINRMDCKNYRKCLADFSLRAFKNAVKNETVCKSCVGCDRYESKS